MVSEVRERLAVRKGAEQKFVVEGFNLRKLKELEVRKMYQIKRRGVCRVLVRKNKRKRPLGRPRYRWEDNIKMDLQEVRWSMDWIDLAKVWTGGLPRIP